MGERKYTLGEGDLMGFAYHCMGLRMGTYFRTDIDRRTKRKVEKDMIRKYIDMNFRREPVWTGEVL